jgi:hypothetical protein
MKPAVSSQKISHWEFVADGFTIPVRITEHRQKSHGVDMRITSVSNGPLLQHYQCCREAEWFVDKLFKKEELNEETRKLNSRKKEKH